MQDTHLYRYKANTKFQMFIGTKHSPAWEKYNGRVYKNRRTAMAASRRIQKNPRYWNYGSIWIGPVADGGSK